MHQFQIGGGAGFENWRRGGETSVAPFRILGKSRRRGEIYRHDRSGPLSFSIVKQDDLAARGRGVQLFDPETEKDCSLSAREGMRTMPRCTAAGWEFLFFSSFGSPGRCSRP